MNRMFGKKPSVGISGDLLVADFNTAVANIITMDVAQAEALRSEASVTAALSYTAATNGAFLQPQNISPAMAESIAKNSVDAHIKKAQASQIQQFTTAQVAQLQQEDLTKYKGRKVRVTRLNNNPDVFIPLWADKYTGQLRNGQLKGRIVTGTVDDLSFEQNVLVLKPLLAARTILPGREFIVVHVIDLTTLAPAVKIDLV
jgi:hypothetical protein